MSRDNSNRVKISVEPEKTIHRHASLLTQEEMMSSFHIVEFNGSPGLTEWGYDNSSDSTPKKCLLVEGMFEGTILPRNLKKSMPVNIFRNAFCRPVQLSFVEEGTSPLGFKAFRYTIDNKTFASPEENPDNICYCHNGVCPGKGVQNIGTCYYNIPVTISLPHFLHASTDYLKMVDGLSPSIEKHSSSAYVQPDYGIPLDGSSLKIQVNLDVADTKYNTRTKPFNKLTLPLFWLEMGCTELPSFAKVLLRIGEVAPIVQSVLMYLLGFIGIAMMSAACLLVLFFSKTIIPRHLSIVSEYSPLPIISINSDYLSKELRICK